MKYGFIKTAAIAPALVVADTAYNAAHITEAAAKASAHGVKLAVFPELSVTGATCGDLFLHKALIDGAVNAVFEIAAGTAELDTVVVIGAPLIHEQKLYNCAVVMYHGEILGVVPKKNIPARGDFCQAAVFTPAPEKCSSIKIGDGYYPFGADMLFYCDGLHEFNFAVEIGADIFSPNSPSTYHTRAGATIVCGLSATAELVERGDYRKQLVGAQSARCVCGYIYADCGSGESTTDLVFGGHLFAFEKGRLLAESKPFECEGEIKMAVTDFDVDAITSERIKNNSFETIQVTADNYYAVSFDMPISENKLTRTFRKSPFVPEDAKMRDARAEEILNVQAHGLKKRLEHTHAKTAVIGISGGLDSCLALLVAVRAMDLLKRPRTDVIAVTMPCFGTTSRTRTNAEILSEKLGVSFRCVDIKASVTRHFADIGHDENEHNVVYENVQARERTQVLMDISNAEGGMVIGTGDLSELALGWATYNGDHMSMYGVNASLPKTLIRHIVGYYASSCGDTELEKVLLDILGTPVSPELLPAESDTISQKTEDLVGPYELHDFFLYWFLRYGFSTEKLEYMANHVFAGVYDRDIVSKWLAVFMRRFFAQQFKRSCLPDGPKVGSIGVSPRGDLRMPSDASSADWALKK